MRCGGVGGSGASVDFIADCSAATRYPHIVVLPLQHGPQATSATAPPRRRRRLLLVVTACCLGLGLALVGCTSTVRPPGTVAEPTTILLIRDALHRGLLLPDEMGYVEFGRGDWSWYALGNDSWYHVFGTVLWPTRGTLSRREHRAGDAASVRAAMPWAEFDEFVVDREAAERLRAQLAAEFAAGQAESVFQPYLRMAFVPTACNYWFMDNCADAVAQWLEELGCSVSWVPIRLDLRPGQ